MLRRGLGVKIQRSPLQLPAAQQRQALQHGKGGGRCDLGAAEQWPVVATVLRGVPQSGRQLPRLQTVQLLWLEPLQLLQLT